MRPEKWLISNLDDSQKEVIDQSIDDDIIVQGVAGSGKTNLAILRALKAKNKGSYAIIVLTVALRRMIAYGMNHYGLDKERVAYEWSWTNRGFDLAGDVFCIKKQNGDINDGALYLVVNDKKIRRFLNKKIVDDKFSERAIDAMKHQPLYGLDFGDWVDDRFYKPFGRRRSWFYELPFQYIFDFNVEDKEHFELIPSGTIYKPSEEKIDYLIIDEAQDFNIATYEGKIIPRKGKSLSLFGDSMQQMNSQGSAIDTITKALEYNQFTLKYNYRIPKTIAKMAQQIQNTDIDLLSNNLKDGGDSDYPNYPKPIITAYSSEEEELEGIVNRINMEGLDDVAILVPNEKDVMKINKYLIEKHNMPTQVHYRTGEQVPFRTINTLDFSNNNLPCILTYYAAKGSEFDNVFIPFANTNNECTRNAFYVACTRSSRHLYISYVGKRISYLDNISSNFVDKHIII